MDSLPRSWASDFLTALESSGSVTFQTFDDNDELKRAKLAHQYHGTLTQHGARLDELNKQGAGIYVMVNAGNFKGRSEENVTWVRAVFVDFDGTPLPQHWELEPHILVESSPGRYHAYWLVSDLPLNEFRSAQKALAAHYEGDPIVCDLPRVMRVPGFYHNKAEPTMVRLLRVDERPHYERSDLLAAWAFLEEALKPMPAPAPRACIPTAGADAGHARRYALAALKDEHATVAATKEGGRNHALNKAAYSLGQLVAVGALEHHEVVDALQDAACACGLSDGEAMTTIRSGLEAGMKNPRDTTGIATNSSNYVPRGNDLRQRVFATKNRKIAINKTKHVPHSDDLRQLILPQIQKWGTTPKPPPINWVVDKLFQDNAENLLAGEPGMGKTWVVADLAIAVASGTPFMGRHTSQGGVLIINFDDSETLPRGWSEKACRVRGYEFDDLPVHYWQPDPELPYPPAGLATPYVFEHLKDEAGRLKPCLIIVDAYSSAFTTLDGNKNQDVVQAFEYLRQLRIAAGGCCVVLIDHTPKKLLLEHKRRGVSGSQQKHARSRTVHILSGLAPSEAPGDILEWVIYKANATRYQAPFGIERRVDERLGTASLIPCDLPGQKRAPKESQAAAAALTLIQARHGEAIHQQELIDQVRKRSNVGERTIRQALVDEVRHHHNVMVKDIPGRGSPKAYRWHGGIPDEDRED